MSNGPEIGGGCLTHAQGKITELDVDALCAGSLYLMDSFVHDVLLYVGNEIHRKTGRDRLWVFQCSE